MIERSEFAGDVIGLVEGGRGGRHEADILRHRRESGKQGDRLELGDITLGRAMERLRIGSARSHTVSHEDQIELRSFGDLRQLDIVGEIRTGVGLRQRMPPGGNVVPGRIKKSPELQLPLSVRHRLLHHGCGRRLNVKDYNL